MSNQERSSEHNLMARFLEQVTATPDATALIMGGQTYTYRQVNERSNQVAWALRELGVTYGTLVGICMRREAEAIFAVCGVIKAGGAYLPIDPSYPIARQRYMVEDAKLQILITDSAERGAPLTDSVSHILAMEDESWQQSHESTDLVVPVAEDGLFHVLYTSGSTGNPKGVCGSHSQTRHRLQWFLEAFPLEPQEVWCNKTVLHFPDASVEIFGALLHGSPLVILPEKAVTNPEAMVEVLASQKVTRLLLVVSHLRMLLLAQPDLGQRLPHLKLWVVNGERLTQELVRDFYTAAPQAQLVNLYGSTEVPDISFIPVEPDPSGADVPIGYPVSESTVYIVDEALQRLPSGEVGELVVSGPGMALEYLLRPDQTAARFLDNPFAPTGRIYRTGDRAFQSPDGLLHYVGRVDHLVKIRGYRVELAEIEVALSQADPAVSAGVVMVQQDPQLTENKRLIAFVTPQTIDVAKLTTTLRAQLPAYMVPEQIMSLAEFPLTLSGKVNRQALLATVQPQGASRTAGTMPREIITQLWQRVLQVEQVTPDANFFEAGGNSLRLAQLYQQLRHIFGQRTPTLTALLQYPTIESQAQYFNQPATLSPEKPTRRSMDRSASDIAIIGVACRFPGAENPQQFWQNLRHGVESITFFTDAELEENNPTLLNNPNYVKAGAILSDIAGFDADFFAYSPSEAAMLDPQQRILLECAWEALEAAGYAPDAYPGRVGVYAGSGMSHYFLNQVQSGETFTEVDLRQFQAYLANDRNFLPTRISYKLNLTGPSVNIQTACSTGLVVVHQACQSLLLGECDLALAGTVSLRVPLMRGYLYEEGMVRSPDGHCRAFDAAAEGTLFGNGGGMVVLKRAREAVDAGDPILAIIKGSAINNDGAGKVSFTAPSIPKQAAVIVDALNMAEIDPVTISYVEAHGTGTRLGDPSEILGLTQAFERLRGADRLPTQFCAIGSVKTNIGHLDEAAGMAGLIKTVLALKHKEIPPSLHFKQPNPQIDFENSPFYVKTELSEWETDGIPRRAGVSSFGMGGTNSHLVLEEAPVIARSSEQLERDRHLLALSAKTPQALEQLTQRYVDYLVAPSAGLADICFTANTGRKHFNHRAAFVAESNEQLRTQLERFLNSGAHGQEVGKNRKIAFLFTGQGSQYVDMGRQLYESQPIFRQTIDRCDEILRVGGYIPSLLSILYPEAGQASPINETEYTQPALFAVEYALYQVWKSWGIEPDVVMGHSVGEYVAACVAGVFSLSDGLKLIAERGRLMQGLPRDGSMVSVRANEEYVALLIHPYEPKVSIAAVNGPESVVISGHKPEIDAICATLDDLGMKSKKLNVSHAFHSPLMEPMLADFEQVARQVSYSSPQIKLISNVTGQLANHEVTTAEYWVPHVRQPVRFAQGMESLERLGANVFIEIGPKPILLGMGRNCLPEQQGLWLPSLRPKQDDWQQLLSSLRDLYLAGVPVDWVGFEKGCTCRRVSLPTYPWQRERHWIEPISRHQQSVAQPSVASKPTLHPLLGQRLYLSRTQDIYFQAFIRPDSPIWVADHKIFGNVIIPGVAYFEMALAAGKALRPESTRLAWLEDVSIAQALIIPEQGQTVQMVLSPHEEHEQIGYLFETYSLSEEYAEQAPSWVLHASGKLFVQKQVPEAAPIDLATLRAHCSEEVSVDTLYEEEMARQMDMGPMMRGVKQLWRYPLSFAKSHDAVALAKVSLPEALLFESDAYHFHPVLLDAGLQMMTVSYPEASQGQTYVPVGIERLRVYGRASSELWCRAQYRAPLSTDQGQAPSDELPKKLVADLHFFDDLGRVVAVMEGVQSIRARREAMLRTQRTEEAWRNWLYQVVWQPEERVNPTAVTGHWLILADHQVGPKMGYLLRSQGASYTLLFRGEGYEQIDDHRFRLNPANPEAFQAVLHRLPALQGVVNCWSLENLTNRLGSTTELEQALLNRCASTLHLVQALTALPVSPRLWLVTQGAQSILDVPVRDVLSSAGWGIGKVIALEHPELKCVQVDLDPEATTDLQAEALFKELQSKVTTQLEDSVPFEYQVAFRRQTRYVARLAPYPTGMLRNANQATSEVRFRSDSSYLITGGLGGLGLKVARFMVERGAIHLVLVGRSYPSRALEELNELKALGAQLTIAQADVSVREQVAQVFNQISPEVPLRGIMHLAGVLDDGVLQQQSWQRFAKVLAPKAVGAWHLHTLTQNRDLDFFVLFSSITSLLGNAGQANYAAANAFLDGLASYRQAQGLPALSINWGSWAEVGMSARLGLDERLSQKGEGLIPPAQGLEALANLLNVQAEPSAAKNSIGVIPIEWPRFLAQHKSISPFLANFTKTLGTENLGTTFRDQLEGTAPQKRLKLLQKHVQEQVARTLGLKPSMYLDPETGFFALGMDSLSSIELRNLLQSSLGCSLPTTLLFDYPTPKALVAYLAQELLPKEELAVRSLPITFDDDMGQEPEPDEEDGMSEIDEMAQLLAAELGVEFLGT